MNGAPNEARTHSRRFASLACSLLHHTKIILDSVVMLPSKWETNILYGICRYSLHLFLLLVLHGYIYVLYLFIICLDCVLWTLIDLVKKWLYVKKKQKKNNKKLTIFYADDLALLPNTPAQAESLQNSLDQAAGSVDLYVKANKTEFICFKGEKVL